MVLVGSVVGTRVIATTDKVLASLLGNFDLVLNATIQAVVTVIKGAVVTIIYRLLNVVD